MGILSILSGNQKIISSDYTPQIITQACFLWLILSYFRFEFGFLLFPQSKTVLKPRTAELFRKIKILSFVVRLSVVI